MKSSSLEAHERWSYDAPTRTQKLVRLVALCRDCHEVTHIGLAQVKGRGKFAEDHLKKVRGFTSDMCEQHINEAFATWKDRSLVEWNLDLSILSTNGISIQKPIDKFERRSVASAYFQSEN